MKIGPSLTAQLSGLLPAETPPADSAARDAAAPAAAATGRPATPVKLSSAASAIGRMASAGADLDTAKIQAIQSAIREGRFTVNAQVIADQLIAEASAMISPRTH